jgi:hypothetical protein
VALSVAELQPVLHDLFTRAAESLALDTGFQRRARRLTGATFAQSVVFSLLEGPAATLDDYADAAADLGADVSPQAFDRRLNHPAAADFLQGLFLEAFNRSFGSARPATLPLLRRFNGVYVRDATLVALPESLAGPCPGRAGRGRPRGRAAACKVVLELEVTSGRFTEASLLPGTANDRAAEVAAKPLPKGALLLEDMGFLSGERLQSYIDQGVYVVTRVPARTAFFDGEGRPFDLRKALRKARGWRYERDVQVMHGHRVKVRLVATRLADEEAEKRRDRVKADARKRGRAPGKEALELCGWNVLVTNAPASVLSADDLGAVRRVRWQVELVFKAFKSEGGLGRCRTGKPGRALAELFGRLLGMVVQQWALLAAGYVMLRHSAYRAARRVRRRAKGLLKALARPGRFGREVKRLARQLHRRCAVASRKKGPSTLDRLTALDPHFDQPHQVDGR